MKHQPHIFAFVIALFFLANPGRAWINPGFETGDLSGWSVSLTGTGTNYAPYIVTVTAGAAPHTQGTLCVSPTVCLDQVHTGVFAAMLDSGSGDAPHLDAAQISQSDVVPEGKACLSFWFAAVVEGHHYIHHEAYGSDGYVLFEALTGTTVVYSRRYSWYDNQSALVDDGADPYGPPDNIGIIDNPPMGWLHLPWTEFYYDFSAYAGQTITIRFTAVDCNQGAHYALGYVDDISWIDCSLVPTPTLTPTLNPEFSLVPTNSYSPAQTPTATDIPADTLTGTPTFSATSTPTATYTSSPSASPTATRTSSATGTPTTTHTSSASKTHTATSTNSASATPTATFTSTASHTPTNTSTRTASATATATSTVNAHSTPAATSLSTPRPSTTGSPTRSATAGSSPSRTPFNTATASATVTATPSATVSVTSSPTPTSRGAVASSLVLTVYNSAGETVRALFRGRVYAEPLRLSLSASALVPGCGALAIYFSGPLEDGSRCRAWDGMNDQGQAVANGLYYLKAQNTDSFGRVTTLVMEVLVMNASGTFVEIFNAAGELVKSIPVTPGQGAAAYQPPSILVPDATAFVAGSGGTGVRFDLGTGVPVFWDGTAANGLAVRGGTYDVRLIAGNGSGTVAVTSVRIAVLDKPSRGLLSGAILAPNPARGGQVNLLFPALPGGIVTATFATVAGGTVAVRASDMASGRLALDLGSLGLAPGIYLVSLRARTPQGFEERTRLKLGVVN